MGDFRVQTAFLDHPKTVKLIRRTTLSGAWCFLRLWGYCADCRPDGDLSGMSDEDIEIAGKWDGDPGALVAALVEVRYLDGPESGRRVHQWVEHQPWLSGSRRREEQARVASAVRWHKLGRHAQVPLESCPLCCEHTGSNALSMQYDADSTGNRCRGQSPDSDSDSDSGTSTPLPPPPSPEEGEDGDGEEGRDPGAEGQGGDGIHEHVQEAWPRLSKATQEPFDSAWCMRLVGRYGAVCVREVVDDLVASGVEPDEPKRYLAACCRNRGSSRGQSPPPEARASPDEASAARPRAAWAAGTNDPNEIARRAARRHGTL